MVSPCTDQSRDGNIAILLGPRFGGETERIGNIAILPITASHLHTVDAMMIGRLRARYREMWVPTWSEFGDAI